MTGFSQSTLLASPKRVTTQHESLLWTLEEISRLVSHSGHPQETLDNIVQLIQRTFDTDVCSVYLLEPDRATLVLAATVGLHPESVGRVRTSIPGSSTSARREKTLTTPFWAFP
jgi:GAF domain-containing protein